MGLRVKTNKATGRDYSYDTGYEDDPEQVKRREGRNKARRMFKGKVKKGQDIDHKNFDATDDSPSNLHVMSKSGNRAKKPPRLRSKKT